MKHIVIALCLGFALVVAGCNDEPFAQKLQAAEKQIAQLEADYQQSQTQLTQKQNELAKLKASAAKAESDYDFPALQPEIVTVFHRSMVVSHRGEPRMPPDPEETPLSISAFTAKTGFEWLDKLLLMSLFPAEQRPQISPNQTSQEMMAALQRYFDTFFQEQVQTTKRDKQVIEDHDFTLHYVEQRKNRVTFKRTYIYDIGARLVTYDTEYLNVDTDKQALITLDDLVEKKHQRQLHDLLWQEYVRQHTDQNGEFTGFASEANFYIPENFYFVPSGIKFVYPADLLAPNIEGEVELQLPIAEVNHLLNPKYRLTKKDGFGLEPIQ